MGQRSLCLKIIVMHRLCVGCPFDIPLVGQFRVSDYNNGISMFSTGTHRRKARIYAMAMKNSDEPLVQQNLCQTTRRRLAATTSSGHRTRQWTSTQMPLSHKCLFGRCCQNIIIIFWTHSSFYSTNSSKDNNEDPTDPSIAADNTVISVSAHTCHSSGISSDAINTDKQWGGAANDTPSQDPLPTSVDGWQWFRG